MQRRSLSYKRVESLHQFSAPKSKSATAKNEWGENFIMDRCGLPCVPSLKGRENVQFISLQHNLIGRIDSLSSFRTLKVLNLYDNKIERITGLDTLASLRVLMLGKNRLKSTEGLESLQCLDILDLHNNQISALTGLGRLRALRVLNLAANSLKKLPSLDGLTSLEELNAKRNRICKIVPEVAHAKRLERLYLSNNELRRLDDVTALIQLTGLKELSLDGNPLTFNANYVVFVVSSLPSLVLLDQNVISPSLRAEADGWSSSRRALGSAGGQHDAAKIKALVTVQQKAAAAAAMAGGSGHGTPVRGAITPSKIHQRSVAVVRPMSVHQMQQHQRQSTDAEPADAPAMKPCLVRTDSTKPRHKSFRQIAFSAMVCNAAGQRTSAADGGGGGGGDERPVFRFRLRPPTAEYKEKAMATNVRSRSSDFGDSSSSWNTDTDDDSDTGSFASAAPVRKLTKPLVRSASTSGASQAALRSPSGGKSPPLPQKLSATIGVNVKEQLRDLRIIVSEEEIHVTGLNIVRMLHNIQWTPDEVELFHTLVFYGLSFDQLAPFYSAFRRLFPNLRTFSFRKVAAPPNPRHVNALAQLESPSWTRWSLGVETLSPAAHRTAWQQYAVYRLHPFGLAELDGRTVRPDDVADAEEQYGPLDSLAALCAPSSALRRQLERFSSLDAGQTTPSSSSTSSSESVACCVAGVGQQHQQQQSQSQSRDAEYAALMKKRAIRNLFQPLKEAKHLRNRSAQMQYAAEYGMEAAIKLSLLSQNWDRLLGDMVRTVSAEIADEAAYKRARLAHIRTGLKNPGV